MLWMLFAQTKKERSQVAGITLQEKVIVDRTQLLDPSSRGGIVKMVDAPGTQRFIDPRLH
ncbi:hypothetical protein HRbin36_02638 [bacterium HR36]|nr:hypothetical protein HRbin36_02638 [bacterium HR36]